MTNNSSNRGVNLSAFDPLASSRPVQQQPQQTAASARNLTADGATAAVQQQQLNVNQVQYLQQQGFSSGLIAAFAKHAALTPLRVWILDNSSAMAVPDAHRIVGGFSEIRNATDVTRWEELQDCVAYHAQAASLLPLPTRFALVNPPGSHVGPSVFGVGESGPAGIAGEVQVLKTVMTRVQPSGPTPLSLHLRNLHKYISSIAPQLVQNRQTATIALATQGLPTDAQGITGPAVTQEFVQCLQSFSNLPVMIVVRLCTDDENVFDFYNSLDARLQIAYDVLDDFFGEALEVYLRNPWLTYGLPLHRFRETGFSISILDTIDERALTLPEVRDLMTLLFAVHFPDPIVDYQGFLHSVSHAMAREKQQWNPITKTVTPWINIVMLHAIYNPAAAQRQPQPTMPPPQQQPWPGQPAQQQQFQQQQQQHVPQTHQSYAGYQQQARPQQGVPPPPPPQQQAAPKTSVSASSSTPASSDKDALAVVKQGILTTWAMQPPNRQNLKPIQELLGSIHKTFPPAFGVEPHDYFEKYKPFSLDALSSQNQAVLKRAVRKLKFFLHPDKLPRDFSEKQSFLCKMLWDITADAWEAFDKN